MHHDDEATNGPVTNGPVVDPTDRIGGPANVHRHDPVASLRHRLRNGVTTPRGRYLAAALAATVGIGLVAAAVAGAGAERHDVATTSADQRNRATEAARADRAQRNPVPTGQPLPTTSATPVPTGSVTPAPTRTSAALKASTRTTTKAKPKPKAAWLNPMPGAEITSCYGMRGGVLHAGIDLAMPADTPIRAVGAGTVVEAGWAYAGYGISVVVDHGNGYLTHYAHLNRAAVGVNRKVSAGTVIGYEGSTGDSTGPHLHFEVHQGVLWNQLDPAPWMRARGIDLGC